MNILCSVFIMMMGWSIATKSWEAAAAAGDEENASCCGLWFIVWLWSSSIGYPFLLMNGWWWWWLWIVVVDGGVNGCLDSIYTPLLYSMQPTSLIMLQTILSLPSSNHCLPPYEYMKRCYSLDDIDMHCCNQCNISLITWHHRLQITIALHHITQRIIKLYDLLLDLSSSTTNYAY